MSELAGSNLVETGWIGKMRNDLHTQGLELGAEKAKKIARETWVHPELRPTLVTMWDADAKHRAFQVKKDEAEEAAPNRPAETIKKVVADAEFARSSQRPDERGPWGPSTIRSLLSLMLPSMLLGPDSPDSFPQATDDHQGETMQETIRRFETIRKNAADVNAEMDRKEKERKEKWAAKQEELQLPFDASELRFETPMTWMQLRRAVRRFAANLSNDSRRGARGVGIWGSRPGGTIIAGLLCEVMGARLLETPLTGCLRVYECGISSDLLTLCLFSAVEDGGSIKLSWRPLFPWDSGR